MALVSNIGRAFRGRRRVATDRDRGDAARDSRNWPAAADAYRRHVDRHPDDGAIWIQLGHMLKEAHQLRPASQAYLTALKLDPNDADLLLNIGHVAKLRGLRRAAALAYRMSYQVDKNLDARQELTNLRSPKALQIAERRLGPGLPARGLEHMGIRESRTGHVDRVDGWHVAGWAIDRDRPGEPANVTFFHEGRRLCDVTADHMRYDVDSMGYGAALAGFEAELPLDLSSPETFTVSARLTRNGEELTGSPFAIAAPVLLADWLQRKRRVIGEELDFVRERSDAATSGLLSIVMPVFNPRADWLAEAIESVIEQWCGRWELICVDDCSPDPRVRHQLEAFAARDPRVRVIALERNSGIAAATNAGIAQAAGDFVAFMDHDDYLEPDAVTRILKTAAVDDVDFIYSDEAVTGEDINVIRSIAARPAFSEDYYLSHPYFVHLNAARLSVVREIGGLDETMSISADVDFVLRMIGHSRSIAHVPAVLYRWRTHHGSTGHSAQHRVTAATLGALDRALKAGDKHATVRPGYHFNTHRIDYPDDRAPTLIVIPTKNGHDLVAACLASIWRTTRPDDDIHVMIVDHASKDPASIAYFKQIAQDPRISIMPYSGPFNYARMNNLAVKTASDRFKYVLLMNNDVEAIESGWLERLRGLAGREEVGVAGASLIYENDTYQHSGVVMGLGDLVDHAHKFVPLMNGPIRNLGYNCSLVSTRDYLAVTGACMMLRREVFIGVGGFDERLEIGYNDTDLCLRIGSLGFKILNDAFALLYHRESITRQRVGSMDHPEDYARFKRRWGHILAEGDPFYNPALAPKACEDHRLTVISLAEIPARVRATRPPLLPLLEGMPDAVERRLRSR